MYPQIRMDAVPNCILALNKIQAAICQRPYESQNRKIRIMTIVCGIITNLAALLRFSTRFCLRHTLGSDDWFIGLAVVRTSSYSSTIMCL